MGGGGTGLQVCGRVSLTLGYSQREVGRGKTTTTTKDKTKQNKKTNICFTHRGIIGRNCPKYNFCRDKSMLVPTKPFLRQTHFLSRQIFAATNINVLSWQEYFCHDKRRVLSRQKRYLWQLPPMIGGRGDKNTKTTKMTNFR